MKPWLRLVPSLLRIIEAVCCGVLIQKIIHLNKDPVTKVELVKRKKTVKKGG
jgi:hypothetical protein